ncbi:NAD(P)-binding domain-containing protein [Amycolatopsis japonica]|uniref:NAD(P)-binding domain-containing protein n=1 Tax=Amycolatopsis japonica TaxID=208439 RepID=UPI0037BD7FBC
MKVLIVGAGPAGIAAARELLHFSIPFDIIDSHTSAGGSWNSSNPSSAISPAVQLITSRRMTSYSDAPMGDSGYPQRKEILPYLTAYFQSMGIDRFFCGQHYIESIAMVADSKWQVSLSRKSKTTYDCIVIATGANRQVRVPSFSANLSVPWMHASKYTHPGFFAGKRVLLVGMGNSAVHIAREIVGTAAAVYISTNSGRWISPRYDDSGLPTDYPSKLPTDVDDQASGVLEEAQAARQLRPYNEKLWSLGVPQPEAGPFSHTVIVSDDLIELMRCEAIQFVNRAIACSGGQVHLSDGRQLLIDAVVFATGYLAVPKLAAGHLSAEKGSLFGLGSPNNGLYTIGNIDSDIGGFWTYEVAASIVARLIDAKRSGQRLNVRLPSLSELSGGCVFPRSNGRLPRVHGRTYLKAAQSLGHSLGIEVALNSDWKDVL